MHVLDEGGKSLSPCAKRALRAKYNLHVRICIMYLLGTVIMPVIAGLLSKVNAVLIDTFFIFHPNR